MLLVGIVIIWALFISAFVFVWARLHQVIRSQEGIDEEAYVNGRIQSRPATGATRRAPQTRHPRVRLTLAHR